MICLDQIALLFMEVDGNEWQQWKARVWNQIAASIQGHPGLAPLEQWMRRSAKEKRCIECGKPGQVREESIIVACVSHYWMCDECAGARSLEGGDMSERRCPNCRRPTIKLPNGYRACPVCGWTNQPFDD